MPQYEVSHAAGLETVFAHRYEYEVEPGVATADDGLLMLRFYDDDNDAVTYELPARRVEFIKVE